MLEIEYWKDESFKWKKLYESELKSQGKLWIVGKVTPPDWEYFGVFSTYERALKECKDEYFFIAPVEVDVSETDEIQEFEGIVFPLEDLTEKE